MGRGQGSATTAGFGAVMGARRGSRASRASRDAQDTARVCRVALSPQCSLALTERGLGRLEGLMADASLGVRRELVPCLCSRIRGDGVEAVARELGSERSFDHPIMRSLLSEGYARMPYQYLAHVTLCTWVDSALAHVFGPERAVRSGHLEQPPDGPLIDALAWTVGAIHHGHEALLDALLLHGPGHEGLYRPWAGALERELDAGNCVDCLPGMRRSLASHGLMISPERLPMASGLVERLGGSGALWWRPAPGRPS